MTRAAATEGSIEKHIRKHMGCMAGFRQLFERHHIAAAATKRLYFASNLPSSPPASETTTPSEESEKSTPPEEEAESTPPESPLTPAAAHAGAAKSTWKSGRDAPRLSLDSRAVTDSKGCLHPKDIHTTEETQHHRSPSVVARLMGLEPSPPPPLTAASGPELRRSSSESRASRDLFFSRFENFSNHNSRNNVFKDENPRGASNLRKYQQNQQRRCFSDTRDAIAEPKKKAVSHDMETLRQILEALKLKGLLHSSDQIGRRHFVYDISPPVLIKSSRSTARPTPINRRIVGDCSPKNTNTPKIHRNNRISGKISPSASPLRETNIRRSSSSVKPKPLSVETKRRANEIAENRRVSPVHSPKVHPRRTGPNQPRGENRSPRGKKPTTVDIRRKEKTATITITTIAEDESSSVSGYSYSTSTDTERSKAEDKDIGTNLSERCRKLLHSIAEVTSTDAQPSPVSVLDYKDEPFTPSPVTTRRKIEFKASWE